MLDAYHVSRTMINVIGELSHLILTTSLRGRFYCIPCLKASLSVLFVDLQDLLLMLKKDDILSVDVNPVAEVK